MNNFKIKKINHGSVLVEMAILLLPIVILVFVTMEFGRSMHQENQLTKSVGVAGRYIARGFGVVDKDTCTVSGDWNDVIARANNIFIYGDIAGSSSSTLLFPGIDSLSFNASVHSDAIAGDCVISVSSSGPYQSMLGLFSGGGLFPDFSLQLNAATEERYIGE